MNQVESLFEPLSQLAGGVISLILFASLPITAYNWDTLIQVGMVLLFSAAVPHPYHTWRGEHLGTGGS